MASLNTIIEYEGAVIDVRPRYWAAHEAAVTAMGFQGPPPDEFWRLLRTGSPDAMMIRRAKAHQVAEYQRLRDEQRHSTELMALDEAPPNAVQNLRILKEMGSLHAATFCPNREGINITLDRLDLWMYFEQKRILPQERGRRVAVLKELAVEHRTTLAVAGTVTFAYTASEAGCRVVGMKTGPTFPKFMQQVGVDVFFDSLDDLTDAIARRSPELQKIGIC